MSNATQAKTTITIVLTGRPPVRVHPEDWPIVASAEDCDDRAHPFQANQQWALNVRQHADGRSIVYGYYWTAFAGRRNRHGGVLVPAREVPGAIAEVARLLDFDDWLAQECVADLPPVDLNGEAVPA